MRGELNMNPNGIVDFFKDLRNNTRMKNLFNRKQEPKLSLEDQRRAALAKEKLTASRKGEPWVAVLDTQVNPGDIRSGFFELDWNNEFIERLLDAGYTGETQEEIMDSWFRTIVVQMLEEEGIDSTPTTGYINVVPIDKGRSEVS